MIIPTPLRVKRLRHPAASARPRLVRKVPSNTVHGTATAHQIKAKLARVPGVLRLVRATGYRRTIDEYDNLAERSVPQLLAIIRHEAHRIEKSMSNNIFESKHAVYAGKRDRVRSCLARLTELGFDPQRDPTARWALEVVDSFNNLDGFIQGGSRDPEPYDPTRAEEFVRLVRDRRSVRVWADDQPDLTELRGVA